jgi:dTDP-4-dehydrorhamnose reductase
MNVLVTGVSGLLGVNLSLLLAEEHRVTGIYHQHRLRNTPFELLQADLSDASQLANVLEQSHPEIIINCAAMANLDRCEEQPQAAMAINADMPALLAKQARRLGIQLIHISTDAVFDGIQGGYSEADIPNPLGVYAMTKFVGEKYVTAEYPEALVARVNFYGCSISGARSLAEWFFNHLSAGNTIYGFTDVYFCPLFVDHLVKILWTMAEKGIGGLYHVVSSECLSKYDFGVQLARLFNLNEALIFPSSWQKAGLKALRSPNLCLDTSKIQRSLSQIMPGQAIGLEMFQNKISSGFPDKLKNLLEPVTHSGD